MTNLLLLVWIAAVLLSCFVMIRSYFIHCKYQKLIDYQQRKLLLIFKEVDKRKAELVKLAKKLKQTKGSQKSNEKWKKIALREKKKNFDMENELKRLSHNQIAQEKKPEQKHLMKVELTQRN